MSHCSFSFATAVIVGLFTITRIEDHSQRSQPTSWADEILPRHQTEEWKGWMQIMILLYHYFGMSQTIWVYRLVRLLVASYIFLTGYSHTSYFIRTSDYSLRRVMTVLLRINLLTIGLAFIMDKHYQFYYFPLLASLWFLVTWATTPRTSSAGTNYMLTCFSMCCSMGLLRFVLGHKLLDGFFSLLFH